MGFPGMTLTRIYFLLTIEGGDERGLPGEVRGRGGASLCQDQVESSALESCQEHVITIITSLLDSNVSNLMSRSPEAHDE